MVDTSRLLYHLYTFPFRFQAMDSSDTLLCDVCLLSVHRNDWDTHINGRKHCNNQNQNKRKYAAMSISGKYRLRDLLSNTYLGLGLLDSLLEII